MSLAHSHIGASSMHRWSACPGSVRLSIGVPSITSRYAEEGTEAHELAAAILSGQRPKTDVDPEMLEAVEVYVREVKLDIGSAQAQGGWIKIEHRFDLSEVHPGLFGTADGVVYLPAQKLLRVYDYKHGAGVPVEVEENEQLMYYGLGALLSTGALCDEVELVIVQPRCPHPKGPVRRWRFDTLTLLDFEADLKAAAIRTEDPNAPLHPGDHCRFCPAAGVCPEIHGKAQAVAKSEFGPIAEAYDPEKLAEILTWLPVLEDWTSRVREFAYALASQGKKVPGWKLVEKRATRKWIDEKQVEDFLRKEFHQSTVRDFFDPPTLKSPAQIEKVLHKKQHDKLAPFMVAKSSGNTLVPASDPRPEVLVLDAKTEFQTLDLLS